MAAESPCALVGLAAQVIPRICWYTEVPLAMKFADDALKKWGVSEHVVHEWAAAALGEWDKDDEEDAPPERCPPMLKWQVSGSRIVSRLALQMCAPPPPSFFLLRICAAHSISALASPP